MRRVAAIAAAVGTVGLLGWAAYLALLAPFGPGDACSFEARFTFARDASPGPVRFLVCTSYVGAAHRLMLEASVLALAGFGLVAGSLRLVHAGRLRPAQASPRH